jgi:hypothetical protein
MKSAFNGDNGGDNVPAYDIVISETTLQNIIQYKSDLASGVAEPGMRLKKALAALGPTASLTTEQFLGALLQTKQPMIFAESEIRADGTDWMHRELALLGDINVTMNAKAYDNGVWKTSDKNFKEHSPPIDIQLMFTPGALLGVGHDFAGVSPDHAEVVSHNRIDQDKYNALVERRLLPLLAHANARAEAEHQKAVITLPGIGCGAFAGEFKGQMGGHLNTALQAMLEKHGTALKHIALVYFDPFGECSNSEKEYGDVVFRVRPALLNRSKPQLLAPQGYEEKGDSFATAKLYKIVAWDHASLPGNDFFGNSRMTDDGVSAAATNSMEVITGIRGKYQGGAYRPPVGFDTWEDVAMKFHTHLKAQGNVKIVTAKAEYLSLAQYESKQSSSAPAPRITGTGGA